MTERLYGTAATVAASILGGAHIVRVHDVAEMVQVARVADAVLCPQSVSKIFIHFRGQHERRQRHFNQSRPGQFPECLSRRIYCLDLRCFRLFRSYLRTGAGLARLSPAHQANGVYAHREPHHAAGRRVAVRPHGRPLRTPHPVDDQHPLLLGDGGGFRAGPELSHLSDAAPAVWRGMGGAWGRGSVARDGVGIFRECAACLSGILQEGYALGNLLAAVAFWTVFPHWGWRPMFFLE